MFITSQKQIAKSPQTRFFKAKGPPTEEDLKRATRAARRATFGTNGQKGFNRIFYEVHILERKAVEDGVSAQRRAGTGKNAGASIFAAAGAGAAQSNPVLGSGSARLAAAQLSADMAEWHCDVHKDIPWGDIPTLNTADGLKHVDAVAAIQRGERITSLWVPKKFGKNFHDDEDLWADVPEEEPDFEETKMKSGHFSMGGMHEMGKVETGEMDEEVAAGAAGGEEEDEDTAGLLGDDDEFQDEESQRAEQRVRRNMHDYQFGSGVTSGAMHALQAKARRRTLLRVVTGWYNYTENQALQSDVFAFVKLWRMKCVWKRLYRDTIEEKRAREEEERKKREQEERHVQLEEERARSFEEQRLREMEEAEDEAEQARLRMLMERDEELKKLGEQAKAQVELERQQKQLMAEEFAQHQKNKAGVAQEFPKGAEPLRDYLGGSSPGLSAGSGEDGRGEEDDLDLLSDGSDGEDRLLLGFSLGAAREGEKRRRSKDRTVVTDRNTFERYIAEERDTVLADDGKQLFK